MKRLILISLAVAAISLQGCKQDGIRESDFTHFLAETQCSNAWENDLDDEVTAARIKAYLKEEGIQVLDLAIQPSKGDFITCAACHCPSGRTIYIAVSANDGQKLLGLNVPDHQRWVAL